MKRLALLLLIVFTLALILPACSDSTKVNAPANTDSVPKQDTLEPYASVMPMDVTARPDTDSTPFPSSEHLQGVEAMVTGKRENLSNVIITKYDTTTEITGDDALAVFDMLSACDAVTVPDPFHYEGFYVDAIYTVELCYTVGTSDLIQTGSEVESAMNFYRMLPDIGAYGDYGYVYFRDENDEFLELISSLL